MLSDEELERMKPYGEAFIQEQDYMPQTTTTYPFPTMAYVGLRNGLHVARKRVFRHDRNALPHLLPDHLFVSLLLDSS